MLADGASFTNNIAAIGGAIYAMNMIKLVVDARSDDSLVSHESQYAIYFRFTLYYRSTSVKANFNFISG